MQSSTIFHSAMLSPGKLAWASNLSLYVPGVHKLGICELGSHCTTLAFYLKAIMILYWLHYGTSQHRCTWYQKV